LDERRLIERVKSGDADACAHLIRAHYQPVYRLLAHLTRDAHLAEDLCQETFAAAWAKIGAFDGRSRLSTWLHRIAYRRFLDSRRSMRKAASSPPDERTRDPSADAEQNEAARELHAALSNLDEPSREVLAMHYLSGLSYREMAEITGEPIGTMKWKTSAAIAGLRAVLTEAGAENELEGRQTTSPASSGHARAANPAGT
jgi:RNA polymerase sigma-70 factor, ECF subfamily